MSKIPPHLTEILSTLSSRQRHLFACDCAEHVLPFFEQFLPNDDRPRTAIQTARRFAIGNASLEELAIAREDAEGAAWEAGDKAWNIVNTNAAGSPVPEIDAAASAAATAEMCCFPEPDEALEAAVNTALETIVVAAVGVSIADTVWSGNEFQIDKPTLERYKVAEDQERLWQLQQARHYLTL